MKTSTLALRCAFMALTLIGLNACGGAEARKAGFIERGREYLEAANFEKARVEFSNALQVDPGDAQARYYAGVVAEKLGNPRDAVGNYQAAIERDPARDDARAALGRLYLFAGLPDKALELVEPVLAKKPDAASLLIVRGGAKGQKGDLAAALQDGERAVKLAPNDEYAVALLASLYKRQGRTNEASHVLRESLKRMPRTTDLRVALAELELSQNRNAEAEQLLREVIEIDPGTIVHRLRMARLQFALKRPADAEKTLREAIRKWPQEDAPKLALVQMLASSSGAAAAQAELERMLQTKDYAPSSRIVLAEQLTRFGAADKAERVFREIVAAEDTRPAGLSARNRLAALIADRGDTDAALKLIEEVLAASPRDADALALRGNIALARGDVRGAITDLRTVLRDQPGATNVLRALARAHRQNGEPGLAEEVLRSAVQANPGDVDSRLELAQVLGQNGKVDQAVPVLEQLAKDAPADTRASDALFRVRLGKGDREGARAIAADLLKLHPESPLGAYFTGLVDEAEGKSEAAIASYERAVATGAFTPEPLVALVRLEVAEKRTDRAIARLEEMSRAKPDNVIVRNLLADSLAAARRYDAADEAYQAAIRTAPQWWIPYRGRALAQLAAGRQDLAVKTLAAGAAGAAEPSALVAQLAALHERMGQPKLAIGVYEDLLRRQPKSVFAANNLAMLLVIRGGDAASLKRAGELVDGVLAASEDAAVLDTRGWVKYRQGAYDDARKLLQRASDLAPQSPLIRYHLAMAQLKLGDRDAAKRNLQAAVAAKREFLGIDEAKATLALLERAS